MVNNLNPFWTKKFGSIEQGYIPGAQFVDVLTEGVVAAASVRVRQCGGAEWRLAEIAARGPTYRSGGPRLQAAEHHGVPKIRALYEATYLAGLRQAGMPEDDGPVQT